MGELSTHPVAFVTVIRIVAVHLAAKPQLKYSPHYANTHNTKLFLTSGSNSTDLPEFKLSECNEVLNKDQNDRLMLQSTQKGVILGTWDKTPLCTWAKDMAWLLAGARHVIELE